jgi:hypothetical protein
VVMRRECAPGPAGAWCIRRNRRHNGRGLLDSDGRRALVILAGTFFSIVSRPPYRVVRIRRAAISRGTTSSSVGTDTHPPSMTCHFPGSGTARRGFGAEPCSWLKAHPTKTTSMDPKRVRRGCPERSDGTRASTMRSYQWLVDDHIRPNLSRERLDKLTPRRRPQLHHSQARATSHRPPWRTCYASCATPGEKPNG